MFGAPLWLTGLLALAIPLALHLWSRRPGRVIRVGSTRHLGDLPPVRRLSMRLTERLLLALRLGVLAALVLALADPRIVLPAMARVKLIVLLAPEVVRDSSRVESQRWIDSLRQAGAEIRLLAEGFPVLAAGGAAGADANRMWMPTSPAALSLWDRIAEADRRLPSGAPFVVVAGRGASSLGTHRPVLSRRVEWYAPALGRPHWAIVAAWSGRVRDSVDLLLAKGDTGARQLYRRTVSAAAGVHATAGAPAVEVGTDGAVSKVRLLGADAESGPVPVTDMASLRVAIQDSSVQHRRRLELAARLIGEATGRPVRHAASTDSADLVLATSRAAAGPRRMLVEPRWLGLASLPESLLTGWPDGVASRPASDMRQVSMAQALPARDARMEATSSRSRSLKVPLLWAALLLLLVERWLSFRSPARSA